MNINQLKYFISVAQYQNFTKAAKEHYISQTAITQQIQALEESMQVQLFDRSKRPIVLTPAGEVFLNEAKAIVERTKLALTKVKEANSGLSGILRIGYIKGYERSDLSNIMREFHLAYPNIFISCHRHGIDTLSSMLLSNDYDVIFTWDGERLIEDDIIDYINYEKVPLEVALYPSHAFSTKQKISREDLKYENIIYMAPTHNENSPGEKYFMDLYSKAGYAPHIVYKSHDIESVLMMVASQLGISILPSYATSKLENADNIQFIPLIGDDEYENILAVWKKDNSNSALNQFIDFIQHRK